LSGLKALTPDVLLAALGDQDAAVREHAVRLTEAGARHVGGDVEAARILDAVLALRRDAAPRVRYQVAFTLGEWDDERCAEALVELARGPDENIRNAALSSAPRHVQGMLALSEKLPENDPARANVPMLRKLLAAPPALATRNIIIERTNTLSVGQRAEREKVLARYTGVASLKGEARSGAELFQQNCAQCHRLRGEGIEVGPDLGMMAGKPVEQLVVGILDPNAAMESRYQSFTAMTTSGHEVSGIIVAETPTTLTLRAPNRPDETVLRAELKELIAGGLSLMPEGLENALSPQQLADLIAYISSPGGNSNSQKPSSK
jgi:putative heme-binding domain-containing protein